MDHTADDPPSTGKTIFENIGSRQNSSSADRKLVAVKSAAQENIRSARTGETDTASVIGIPDQEAGSMGGQG
jgi:hypothetical protein